MTAMIADELARIPMSPFLAATLSRAAGYADAQGHLKVTIEHLLLALTEDPEATIVLKSSSVDIGRLSADISAQLGRIEDRASDGRPHQVIMSNDLKRILEAAAAAASQGKRREINGAIVLAAIIGEGRSVSAHMLRAQGMTFEEAIKALQRSQLTAAQPPPPGATAPPPAPRPAQPSAEDILASARERVQSRTQPPGGPRTAPPGPLPSGAPPIQPQWEPSPIADSLKDQPRPYYSDEAAKGPGPAPAPEPELPPETDTSLPQILERTQPPPQQKRPASAPPFEAPQPAMPAPAATQPQQWAPPPMPQPSAAPAPRMPARMPPPIPAAPAPPARPSYAGAPPSSAPAGYRPASPQQQPPWSDARSQRGPTSPPMVDPRRRIQGPVVQAGQLVENIPRKMRVAVPIIVEARIARAEVKAIADTMQGGGAIHRHEVMVSKAMTVRLRAPDGGFTIETASPETQWIDNVLGGMADDFASWRWSVTAKDRGKRRLQLIISARTVDGNGLMAETALPDQVIEVKVGVNYAKTAVRLAGWITAASIGGILARFGEDAYVMGREFIAKVIGG